MPQRPAARSALDTMNMVVAARRYYLDGTTKSDIADELKLSRFKVARLLDEAVARGIVSFQIHAPRDVDVDLSLRVAETFGIRQALVLELPDGPPDFTRGQLGRVGAEVLGSLIEPDDVIGVAWGRTLHAMVKVLPPLARCTVVQIVGSVPTSDLQVNSLDLARAVADRAGGTMSLLHVPMVVDSADTARRLRAEPFVRQTVDMFDHLDRALVSVGAWEPGHSALMDAIPDDLRQQLLDAGAVADVCTTILDAGGAQVQVGDLPGRSIAITPEQLRAVPDVVALVGGGAVRAPAIRAALRSGLLHRLITDTATARALLDLDLEVSRAV
jgi:DNA-binding transcriptional regulator LsrR (DeoR family)